MQALVWGDRPKIADPKPGAYYSVYFRIHTPSYYPKNRYGVGFENYEDGQKFHDEAEHIFLSDGWTVEREASGGHAGEMTRGNERLYLHPQSFSGVVLGENIPLVEGLLTGCENFRFEKTDIYEEIFDMMDDQYLLMLEGKREQVEADILSAFKTKRCNLYVVNTYSAIQNIEGKYRIKRLQNMSYSYSGDSIETKFINEVFESLVLAGKIVTCKTKHGTGYRTA